MRRGVLLLGAVPALIVALACACGKGAECEEGERDDWGTCVPVECGEYPFGGFVRGNHVFVSASTYSEEEDQDGSHEEPYDTLTEGIAAAVERSASVVVASGTYRESIVLDDRHDGLVIEGVCGPHVLVEGTELPTLMLDAASETTVEITSVHLSNEVAAGVVVLGGKLVLSNVGVEGALGVGIAAFGTDSVLALTDAVVTGTIGQEDYEDGYGLAVAEGASATITGLEVSASHLAGLLIDGDGTSVVLTGGMVAGNPLTRPGAPAGVVVSNGAHATLADLEVVDAWGVGVEVSGASRVQADRLTVFGTHGTEVDGVVYGSGVVVVDGSRFDAVDVSIVGTALYGLTASGDGTTADLQGGSIEHSSVASDEATAGIGLIASGGAAVSASGVRIAANHVYGAVVSDSGSELVLTDVDVLDTEESPRSTIGGGILVQEGGALDALRVTVAGSGTIGILVDASTATLTDVDVRDTRRGSSQSTAVGVAAQAGSSVGADRLTVTDTAGPGLLVSRSDTTCERCTLSRNAFAGLLAADGARVTLAGAVVEDTVADATEGGGVGVFVESAAAPVELTVTASEVRGNSHAAVYVDEDGTVLVDGSTLVGGEATRTVWPRGTALYAFHTSAEGLGIVGCTISASEGAGLFFDDGTATLTDNRYPGNNIDVVQQLCGPGTAAPVGLEDEPVDVVELCPAFDYPVGAFTFLTVYEPLVLH